MSIELILALILFLNRMRISFMMYSHLNKNFILSFFTFDCFFFKRMDAPPFLPCNYAPKELNPFQGTNIYSHWYCCLLGLFLLASLKNSSLLWFSAKLLFLHLYICVGNNLLMKIFVYFYYIFKKWS